MVKSSLELFLVFFDADFDVGFVYSVSPFYFFFSFQRCKDQNVPMIVVICQGEDTV